MSFDRKVVVWFSDKEWDKIRPWTMAELQGMMVRSILEYFWIPFNPKIDAILDLWFFHNGIQMEKWLCV